VIDIFFHDSSGHAFDRLFMGRAASSTALGSVLVGVKDEEGRNVNSVAAHRQRYGVAIRVTGFRYDSIIPTKNVSKAVKW
jgi:hypothetical protein